MPIEVIFKLAICVALFLIMMVPGFILKKLELVSERAGRDFSNLVLYAAQPFLIINSFMRPFSAKEAADIGISALLAVFFQTLLVFFSMLFFKRTEKTRQTVLRFSLIFSNIGFMGMPLINFIFGADAVVYVSVNVVIFNLFAWTLGYYMYSGDKKYVSLRGALLNPVMIATMIGLLIFFLDASALFPNDGIVRSVCTSLGALVSPLSMIIIGMRLASVLNKESLRLFDAKLFLAHGARLLLAPLLTFVFLFTFNRIGFCSDTVASVFLITASTPAAAITTMLAEKFDGDAPYASILVSSSTILSILTMPLVGFLLFLF